MTSVLLPGRHTCAELRPMSAVSPSRIFFQCQLPPPSRHRRVSSRCGAACVAAVPDDSAATQGTLSPATPQQPQPQPQPQPERRRGRRVRFAPDCELVEEYVDTAYFHELVAVRRAGDMWVAMARDRLRFKRRVSQLEPVIGGAFCEGRFAARERVAATRIQAAVRGMLCRNKCCLSWLNRQSSSLPLEPSTSADSDEGIPFAEWARTVRQAAPFALPPAGPPSRRKRRGNKARQREHADRALFDCS